jgi:hypothetical protein
MGIEFNVLKTTEISYQGKTYDTEYVLVEKNDPDVPEEPFLINLVKVKLDGKDVSGEIEPFDRERIECILWDYYGYNM